MELISQILFDDESRVSIKKFGCRKMLGQWDALITGGQWATC